MGLKKIALAAIFSVLSSLPTYAANNHRLATIEDYIHSIPSSIEIFNPKTFPSEEVISRSTKNANLEFESMNDNLRYLRDEDYDFNLSSFKNDNLITAVHEMNHANNHRVSSKNTTFQYLYLGKGNWIRFREPKITLEDVAKYVPKAHRDNRLGLFNLYFYGIHYATEPRPPGASKRNAFYILDEVNAYYIGTLAGLHDFNQGAQRKRITATDLVGSAEFMRAFDSYLMAVALALKEKDPAYWKSENGKQFRNWLFSQLKQSNTLYTRIIQNKKLMKAHNNAVNLSWIGFNSEMESERQRLLARLNYH